MPSEHARLSASGSKRWMTCPGSVGLEELFPDSTSEFAEEGTTAHALAERMLNHYLETNKRGTYPIAESDKEMVEYVRMYVDKCIDGFLELKEKREDTFMFVETRLDFSDTVPEGFGTGDCIIISDRRIDIIDLKYGRGVEVSAVYNTQLMLYAIGAINYFEDLYEFDTVGLHIVQPRISNMSNYEMSIDELMKFKEEAKAKAKRASIGLKTKIPGKEQCKFCKARGACRGQFERFIGVLEGLSGGKKK